jgi:hypothetical protein
MSYPDEIIVVIGSPEYEVLSHSEVFKRLAENWSKTNEVILTSEFFGDKWPMFVDLFFPEMGHRPLFVFKNRSIQVNPKYGTKQDLAELMDFLLVDDEKTMMNFARNQARKQLNAPVHIVSRETGIRKTRQYSTKKYKNNNINNINNNIEFGFINSNEEDLFGKLSPKNKKKYFPNEGRRSKTRRNLKV